MPNNDCRYCGQPLNISQYSSDKRWKSCPLCSQKAGEHIFYPYETFGFTEQRVTYNNPDGIQSYCPPCRPQGASGGPYAGHKKGSELH